MNAYDGLLAAMPAFIASGVVVGWFAAVPLTVGLIAGSLLAGVLMFALLFVVPPT